jgi:hypothetical protein
MHTTTISYLAEGQFHRVVIHHNTDWSGEVLVYLGGGDQPVKLPGAVILALVDDIGKQRLAARITSLITEKL